MVISGQEQYDRYKRLVLEGTDELEFQVREIAEQSVQESRTFHGGILIPYLPRNRGYIDQPPNVALTYYTLELQLIPELENYPKAARLIAEKILREQIKEIWLRHI